MPSKTKTIDDFLENLDNTVMNIIDNEFTNAFLNHFSGNEEFEKFKEKKYEQILKEFNNLESYNIHSALDYEKLSKAIANFSNIFEEQSRQFFIRNESTIKPKLVNLLIHTHSNSLGDIINEPHDLSIDDDHYHSKALSNKTSLDKQNEIEKFIDENINIITDSFSLNIIDYTDTYIKKYYIEHSDFKSIKDIRCETGYAFDAKGYIQIDKNKYDIYVQATGSEKLEQTDLIFNTVTTREHKKIYILSDDIPKEDLDKFFVICDENKRKELIDILEVIRFLSLSIKIFTKERDKTNENKNLSYFFSIIFLNSKGFDNYHNKKIMKIFLNTDDYQTIDLFKKSFLNKSTSEIEVNIAKYIEEIFIYLSNTINFTYLNNNPRITEPMANLLSNIDGLTTYYLENNDTKNILKEKININYEFRRIHKNYELKTISNETLNKKIEDHNNVLNNRLINNYHNNFQKFINELEKSYITDCSLSTVDDVDLKYSDQAVLRFFFQHLGEGFKNLSYRFKNSKTDQYKKVQEFKKYIFTRIKDILINLNQKHLKELYIIFKGHQSLALNRLMVFLLFKGENIDSDFLNSFKIFLVELVLFPNVLNNKNYPNILNSFENYIQYLKNTDELQKIIKEYKNLKQNVLPQDFVGKLNLTKWDYLYIYKNLHDELNILKEYSLFKLRDVFLGKRIENLFSKIDQQLKNNQYKIILHDIDEYMNLHEYLTPDTLIKAHRGEGLIFFIKNLCTNFDEALVYYNEVDNKVEIEIKIAGNFMIESKVIEIINYFKNIYIKI